MTVLTDALRARFDQWVHDRRVVLFMKGTPAQPQCGFSARVVGLLDGLIDDYGTIDVLADANVREGMKVYAEWPTFPQLWVDGDLIGGCDIVEQMHEAGQLEALLGAEAPPPPQVTLTDAAAARIREVTEGEDIPLRLRISASFGYQFELVEAPSKSDVTVVAQGITLVFDRPSARRADGMTMDFVTGPTGAGLVVHNPNEPAQVQQLTVEQLHAWRREGATLALIDVRTDEEWALARIEGARLYDAATEAWLAEQPRDLPLVVQCHHGIRSQRAAEHFLSQGFTQVFNLSGGIDAWSTRIDAAVPRY